MRMELIQPFINAADAVFSDLLQSSAKIIDLTMDEDTYRRWGFPLSIPRDKLARIIDRVAQARPLLIVVDVSLATMCPWRRRVSELVFIVAKGF